MNMFNRKALSVAVALAAMSAVGAAQAATISAQIGGNTYNYTAQTAGVNAFTFDKFDSSLGTLTAVEFVFSLSTVAGATGEADNEGATPGDVTFDFTAGSSLGNLVGAGMTGAALLRDDFSALGLVTTHDSAIINLGADNGDNIAAVDVEIPDLAGDDYGKFISTGQTDAVTGSGLVNTVAGGLTQYNGTAGQTFSLDMTTTAAFQATGLGSLSQASSPQTFSSSFDIVYTYDVAAVPEPSASLGLMVAGLMGFGAYRRRKSTKAA